VAQVQIDTVKHSLAIPLRLARPGTPEGESRCVVGLARETLETVEDGGREERLTWRCVCFMFTKHEKAPETAFVASKAGLIS